MDKEYARLYGMLLAMLAALSTIMDIPYEWHGLAKTCLMLSIAVAVYLIFTTIASTDYQLRDKASSAKEFLLNARFWQFVRSNLRSGIVALFVLYLSYAMLFDAAAGGNRIHFLAVLVGALVALTWIGISLIATIPKTQRRYPANNSHPKRI